MENDHEKICFLLEAVIYASVDHACCLSAKSIKPLEDDRYLVVLPEAEIVENPGFDFITDVVEAILYLYSIGIIHGDLKVQNIVRHNNRYCLIDHGLTYLSGISDSHQDYQSFSFSRNSNHKMRKTFGSNTSVIRNLGWAIGILILLWREEKLYIDSIQLYTSLIENFIEYPDTEYGNLIWACLSEDFSISKLARIFNLPVPIMRKLPNLEKNRFSSWLVEKHAIDPIIAKVIVRQLTDDDKYRHWLNLYQLKHEQQNLKQKTINVIEQLEYKLL